MEKFIIKHSAFHSIFQKDNEIFKKYFYGTQNFDTFCGRVDRVSKKIIEDYADIYPDDYNAPGSGLDRMKGDIFEIFTEIFMKLLGSHNTIGVYNYEPVSKEDDYGVDGIGKGIDYENLTVQIKYRSDPKTELTERDIKQFTSQSWKRYGVDLNTKCNLLLITTCKGINPITASQVFFGQIREINRSHISKIVRNNASFWMNLTNVIEHTISEIYFPEEFTY